MPFPDDLLSIDDLSAEQLLQVLDVADRLKADRGERLAADSDLAHGALRGRTVALLFEKPSTRTRVSFQVAVTELGGQPLPLSSAELQLGRGETVADTGAVLSRYVHAIVVRTFAQQRLEELADGASIPVVNALTDLEHPCQAVADLQTFREAHGDFHGRALAYVGDGNNVAHSLLLAGAKVGLSVRVGHPEGHAPDAGIVTRARQLAADTGATIEVTTDPVAAVAGADAVYTDVWASMGQEAEAAERAARFVPYRVTEQLLAHAATDAVFLHCLPAHRGEEVTAEVIDGPASRVFDQAENRLHAQKALLAGLLA
ncbi:ornithine carbamoyltransferase [Egicoccus halophilus]|uniref:Ornithine carbamoyltransferase n=1 Tax=Egicoccus halophilus TaxID=1670830 RepID=A0A8J3AF06_9ACTN|nr:ornithine carbamoyltransferase [Egicoccus halophilus]GGI07504.1 ornithine carbamoyltransferase [Egicoccus halophilus]